MADALRARPFTWPDVLGAAAAARGPRPPAGRGRDGHDPRRVAPPTRRSPRSRSLLRAKGETPAELAALVRTMLRFAEPVPIEPEGAAGPLVDTCGTGGDRSHTFNISTVAALVIAGAGRAGREARQPGRVVGLRLGRPARGARRRHRPRPRRASSRCIEEAGIAFCFAQRFHAGDALRRPGPQGARRAHHVQLPRSARQPGPRHAARWSASPTRRWRDRVIGTLARARRRARDGVLRPRRARRAHHHRRLDRARAARRRGPPLRCSTRWTSASPGPATADAARRRRPADNADDRPARARRREGRGARRRRC